MIIGNRWESKTLYKTIRDISFTHPILYWTWFRPSGFLAIPDTFTVLPLLYDHLWIAIEYQVVQTYFLANSGTHKSVIPVFSLWLRISREIRRVSINIVVLDCGYMINCRIPLRVSQNGAETSQKVSQEDDIHDFLENSKIKVVYKNHTCCTHRHSSGLDDSGFLSDNQTAHTMYTTLDVIV